MTPHTCEDCMGQRVGQLERTVGIHDEQLRTQKESVKDAWEAIDKLREVVSGVLVKVAGIVGGIVAIGTAVQIWVASNGG
jgi:hypothetical protein